MIFLVQGEIGAIYSEKLNLIFIPVPWNTIKLNWCIVIEFVFPRFNANTIVKRALKPRDVDSLQV